jgi:mono/diheme cytochrome c family protein
MRIWPSRWRASPRCPSPGAGIRPLGRRLNGGWSYGKELGRTVALLLLLAGCNQYHMIRQDKAEDDGAAAALPHGQTDQPAVPGTVAQGQLEAEAQAAQRPPLTPALLERGRERFDIHCAPCHGRVGDGQGMIVQRGFPHPPTFHQDRLRQAPDRHFLAVIAQGYGAMYPYGARVAPPDRWAITAYIRALQLSQATPAATLPEDLRQRLAP